MDKKYDCIIIGGGHAGIEAALASARLGCLTLLISMNLDTIGLMSCNPAIGGLGKGQLVKEVDALGGFIAKGADECALQYRQLNSSKGLAVRSSRAQQHRQRYRLFVRKTLERQENLFLYQAEAAGILTKKGAVEGIVTVLGEKFCCKTLIISPGTFLNGLIHIGLKSFRGGRLGEGSSVELVKSLRELRFELGSFKTGTCARLDKRTIDYKNLIRQDGDRNPRPFSFSTKDTSIKQTPCYITYTNSKTHKIICSGLQYSPLYSGKIKSTGVRYCPSIEDKVVKFAHHQRHQVFLEPEGDDTVEVYPNGISTSLPLDIQIKMLRSIQGLEKSAVLRPGYGIEHAFVNPTQLLRTLETKLVRNLYFAGQINGTTGYEEAAAQGLIAGINAALRVKGREPLVLGRDQAYIGVLIDDLTTKGTNEPYRMFTSRVEYRLLLREDNADQRLRKLGFQVGLVSKNEYKQTVDKYKKVSSAIDFLRQNKISPAPLINKKLKRLGTAEIKYPQTMEELLRRPQLNLEKLLNLSKNKIDYPLDVLESIETGVKYEGFIKRQLEEVKRFNRVDKIRIPSGIDLRKISGLSREICEKLESAKPETLGQAIRISGVTPAAISLLMIWIKKHTR